MSAAENIKKQLLDIKYAFEQVEKLSRFDYENMDTHQRQRIAEDRKQRIELHQEVITNAAVELAAGFLTDINRIANALEAASKPATLLSTKTGSFDSE